MRRYLGAAALFTLLPSLVAAAPAQRIVSLGGDVTEIVYALGNGGAVVCDDQTALYPPAATKLRQVGYLRTLAAEGVLACRPDLIIASKDAGPPAAVTQLQNTGVKFVQVPNGHDPDGVAQKIAVVADALGRKDEGARLVAKFKTDMKAALNQAAAAKDHPRTLFLMTQGPGGAMAAGSGTGADAMLKLAGANNVATFEGYKTLTVESAIALKPDIILVGTQALDMMGGLKAFEARPEIAMTPAGKSGRIVAMDMLLLLGFGPRMPDALQQLVRSLHGQTKP